jgi:hypothetical protein
MVTIEPSTSGVDASAAVVGVLEDVGGHYGSIFGSRAVCGDRATGRGARVAVLRRPWDVIERDLGTALPDSYKAFIEYFGSGSFSEELQNFTSGIESGAYELVRFVQRNQERWRNAPRHSATDTALFPEPGGDFPDLVTAMLARGFAARANRPASGSVRMPQATSF